MYRKLFTLFAFLTVLVLVVGLYSDVTGFVVKDTVSVTAKETSLKTDAELAKLSNETNESKNEVRVDDGQELEDVVADVPQGVSSEELVIDVTRDGAMLVFSFTNLLDKEGTFPSGPFSVRPGTIVSVKDSALTDVKGSSQATAHVVSSRPKGFFSWLLSLFTGKKNVGGQAVSAIPKMAVNQLVNTYDVLRAPSSSPEDFQRVIVMLTCPDSVSPCQFTYPISEDGVFKINVYDANGGLVASAIASEFVITEKRTYYVYGGGRLLAKES